MYHIYIYISYIHQNVFSSVFKTPTDPLNETPSRCFSPVIWKKSVSSDLAPQRAVKK